MTQAFPRIVDVGFSGILISFSDVLTEAANLAALSFRARVEAAKLLGVSETTTSLTSAYVLYDPLEICAAELRLRLEEILQSEDWAQASMPMGRRLWRVPASFDGDHAPQLDEVASLTERTPDDAIAELCAEPLRVLTLGFAPGQPYLGTLPPNWDIPRQTGLTKQVPIGAITVAIRQVVLFATTAPTGWRQVGQCGFHGFQRGSDDPIALRPGDEMEFYPVTGAELERLITEDPTGNGGATCEALE